MNTFDELDDILNGETKSEKEEVKEDFKVNAEASKQYDEIFNFSLETEDSKFEDTPNGVYEVLFEDLKIEPTKSDDNKIGASFKLKIQSGTLKDRYLSGWPWFLLYDKSEPKSISANIGRSKFKKIFKDLGVDLTGKESHEIKPAFETLKNSVFKIEKKNSAKNPKYKEYNVVK